MQRDFNTVVGELTKMNDTLKATVSTLKEQIEELKGELNICKTSLDNRVLATTSKPKFYSEYAKDKAQAKLTQQGTIREIRDCPERSKISAISKENEVELESEALKSVSIILNSAKAKGSQQIDKWKDKEDFEVIHLDDYDFVLGLNFFDRINALLVPFVDCICILDTHKRQCVVSMSHDEKGGTKDFLAIKLVVDVHCEKNIDSVDRSVTKTSLEMLEVRQTDVKPVELSMGLQPMRE
ncbi:hypothetical protein J1N35_043721, partial [Gossypium stocksii]